ncbi:MAG TPA: 3-oxoacyl-[acyl-carrier-protein] synthase III C-terminal domain-containing protein [Dehalococcoidia bacterium]|nr:3-oxoacyl-[acyl-carrier-protein] synthase III C-terminal domain-containing protein [Dehalococcoidia bacterium]
MVGIVSYGAYIPIYRLSRDLPWLTWGGLPVGGERSVANFDEDSITMAVEAGNNCLQGFNREEIDGLFLASTTTPYKEKQCAGLVAEALDLKRNIRTADFTNSIRSATIALRAAMDAIAAGSANKVLVVATDCRIGMPSTEYEQAFGDGAAAILLSKTGLIATIDGCHTHYDDIMDLWRLDKDNYVRFWEDRFIVEHGYLNNTAEAVKALLKEQGLKPADITKAVLYTHDARRHQQVARNIGFDYKTQVQDSLFSNVGNTGAAYALMMLAGALEEAKTGDKLLLANYGDGADAFILNITDGIAKLSPRRGIKYHLDSKLALMSYDKYLRYRGILQGYTFWENQSAATISWRDRRWNINCRGGKCLVCGNINFPPQRICMYCQSKDQFEEVRLADRRGKLFTYSKDNLGPSLDSPIILCIIDFDDGGRFYAQMTDRDPEKIELEMPVELTFRWMHSERGIRNYYWKCRPLRGA